MGKWQDEIRQLTSLLITILPVPAYKVPASDRIVRYCAAEYCMVARVRHCLWEQNDNVVCIYYGFVRLDNHALGYPELASSLPAHLV